MDRRRDKCFNVFSTEVAWADAQTACEGYGGNLATIESAAEQTAVEGLLAGTDIWIGLNDITTDQEWTWYDGATFSYDNWWTNRPKNNADQDCVKMKTTGLGMMGQLSAMITGGLTDLRTMQTKTV